MASSSTEPAASRRIVRRLEAAGLLAAVGVVIWALVHFVVSDEELLLDYVRVLVWPLVLGLMLYWLRDPLRDKFGQLLRVEGFGALAEFSAEAQARRLSEDLTPDLDSLFQDGSTTNLDDLGPKQVPPVGEDHNAGEAASAGGQSGADGELSSYGPEAPSEHQSDGSRDSGGRAGAVWIPLEDLLDLGRSVGLSAAAIDSLSKRVGEESDGASIALGLMKATALKNRADRNAAVHNTAQSRDAVEAVIRKSAAWGYDMGKAGAPQAVPDVEWSPDGAWTITTEVPSPVDRRPAKRAALAADVDPLRQIKELEDEIKKMERAKHGPFGAVSSFGALSDEPWLRELKRRLRSVDPGNPWSLE